MWIVRLERLDIIQWQKANKKCQLIKPIKVERLSGKKERCHGKWIVELDKLKIHTNLSKKRTHKNILCETSSHAPTPASSCPEIKTCSENVIKEEGELVVDVHEEEEKLVCLRCNSSIQESSDFYSNERNDLEDDNSSIFRIVENEKSLSVHGSSVNSFRSLLKTKLSDMNKKEPKMKIGLCLKCGPSILCLLESKISFLSRTNADSKIHSIVEGSSFTKTADYEGTQDLVVSVENVLGKMLSFLNSDWKQNKNELHNIQKAHHSKNILEGIQGFSKNHQIFPDCKILKSNQAYTEDHQTVLDGDTFTVNNSDEDDEDVHFVVNENYVASVEQSIFPGNEIFIPETSEQYLSEIEEQRFLESKEMSTLESNKQRVSNCNDKFSSGNKSHYAQENENDFSLEKEISTKNKNEDELTVETKLPFPKNDSSSFPENNSSSFPENDSSAFSENDSSTLPENDPFYFPLNDFSYFPENDSSAFSENDSSSLPENDSSHFPFNDSSSSTENDSSSLPENNSSHFTFNYSSFSTENDSSSFPENKSSYSLQNKISNLSESLSSLNENERQFAPKNEVQTVSENENENSLRKGTQFYPIREEGLSLSIFGCASQLSSENNQSFQDTGELFIKGNVSPGSNSFQSEISLIVPECTNKYSGTKNNNPIFPENINLSDFTENENCVDNYILPDNNNYCLFQENQEQFFTQSDNEQQQQIEALSDETLLAENSDLLYLNHYNEDDYSYITSVEADKNENRTSAEYGKDRNILNNNIKFTKVEFKQLLISLRTKKLSENDISAATKNIRPKSCLELFSPTVLCSICTRQFPTNGLLQNHQVAVHRKPEVTFPCTLCNEIFFVESLLRYHKTLCHNEDIRIALSCSICLGVFPNESSLKIHKLKSHRPFQQGHFKCNGCIKRFNNVSKLRKHLKTFHRILKGSIAYVAMSRMKCTVNKKSKFNNLSTFQCRAKKTTCYKINRRLQKNTVQCSICGRKYFANKNKFITNNYSEGKCRVCGNKSREFSPHNHLDLSVTFYSCYICEKRLKYKSAIINHLYNSHSFIYHSEDEIFSRQCYICQEPFIHPSHFAKHLQEIHQIFSRFSCDFCDKHFMWQKNLVDHLQSHFQKI